MKDGRVKKFTYSLIFFILMDSIRGQILAAVVPEKGEKPLEAILGTGYDPMVDLSRLLDDPGALDDMEMLFQMTNTYRKQLDDEICTLNAQYERELNADDNKLTEIKTKIDAFSVEYQDLISVSNKTNAKIDDMTSQIRSLDTAKTNLTYTMKTSQRMQMYTSAYDELVVQIESSTHSKDYTKINQMLSAVLDLNVYFQDFKSIQEINTLHRQIMAIKTKVVDDIFDDFEREVDQNLQNASLIDACRILQLLGEPYAEKLQKWYISTILKDISQIFKSTEEAGSLDNLKRRFIYFQNIITDFETKHLHNFPNDWHMKLKVVTAFCDMTKNDLKNVLSKETRINPNTVDVNLLLDSLSQTLDFEAYLNQKFKYYKSFEEYGEDPAVINFDKSISDVFEPYLNFWIDHQGKQIEKKIQEFSKPDMMFKKSGIESSSDGISDDPSTNVLESSAELFRLFRQLLTQLSKLTRGKPLIRLSKIFGKYLHQYQTKILESILPDGRSLTTAETKDQEEGVDIICLVLNTANYCSITVTQLEDKIKSLITPSELNTKVEFESQKDGFMKLINYCISLLIFKIETDLQMSWRELNNQNWKVLEEVVGESRYLNSVKDTITEDAKVIFNKISKVSYIRNLIDKLLDSVIKSIINNIIKFDPVTIIIAEQFKFDFQDLKSFFLKLPSVVESGELKITNSTLFQKHVTMEFDKVDKFLKILMVPVNPNEAFIDSYFKIIGDSSFSNFMKILNLKGVLHGEGLDSEKEKFKFMDSFKAQLKECDVELEESDIFLAGLKLANFTTNGHQRTRSSYLPTNIGSNTPQLVSPKVTGGGSPNNTGSISNWLGSGGKSPNITNDSFIDDSFDESMDSSSPKPNFGFFQNSKIDTNSLLNTKDHLEKNFKTFTDRSNFNEGFKRFFKRGD